MTEPTPFSSTISFPSAVIKVIFAMIHLNKSAIANLATCILFVLGNAKT
jgi:hypothetical protein